MMETAFVDKSVLSEDLSNLSFAELFELRDRVGEKMYNQLIRGDRSQKQKREFHRENKNRPREMSSKVRPTYNYCSKQPERKKKHVDPRFYSKYGAFDQSHFENNYKFIGNIKKKEKNLLLKEMGNPNIDDSERDRIKLLLQRMENQKKENIRKEKQKRSENVSREYQIKELKEGRKPQFCKKSEKKLFDLVQHFEELQQNGRLIKHIKRRRKKLTLKDRRRLRFLNSSEQ